MIAAPFDEAGFAAAYTAGKTYAALGVGFGLPASRVEATVLRLVSAGVMKRRRTKKSSWGNCGHRGVRVVDVPLPPDFGAR